ncbi:MAG: hypothetical protein GWO02_11245 [Gammaproteobacteria bacterium]|nr:hypothetical protein [Gammaproteobacteria bacterium]
MLAGYFAVGDAAAILGRIEEFLAAGVSKFVLRPLAEGDEGVQQQSQRLIEEVLPVVAEWNAAGVRAAE